MHVPNLPEGETAFPPPTSSVVGKILRDLTHEWRDVAGRTLAMDPRSDKILSVADTSDAAYEDARKAHPDIPVIETFDVPAAGSLTPAAFGIRTKK
jgi:hypothetical protein